VNEFNVQKPQSRRLRLG